MSQTETILLITLGFSLACLIALFLARTLWTAAIKVGARRMQRQVPSSLVALQTERARRRAEYAMLSQRLGTKLEEAKLQIAAQMAEVSRQRNRLPELEALENNRGGETRRLAARVEELTQSLAEARSRETELRHELLRRDQAAAGPSRAAHHPARPAPATAHHQPAEDAEARLRQRIDRLNERAKAPAAEPQASPIAAPPPAEDAQLDERLAAAERHTEELTRDLEKLDAEWQERLATPVPVAPSEVDSSVISLSNRIRDLKKSLGSAS